MHGLMHKLGTRRERSVPSSATGHFGYASDAFPMAKQHAKSAQYDMAWYGTKDVSNTPIR